MNHTPGPWKINIGQEEQIFKRMNNGELLIEAVAASLVDEKGMLCDIWTRNNYQETKANALLISAAPELLEACRSARKQLWGRRRKFSNDDHEAMNLLDAAITKAEGRQ